MTTLPQPEQTGTGGNLGFYASLGSCLAIEALFLGLAAAYQREGALVAEQSLRVVGSPLDVIRAAIEFGLLGYATVLVFAADLARRMRLLARRDFEALADGDSTAERWMGGLLCCLALSVLVHAIYLHYAYGQEGKLIPAAVLIIVGFVCLMRPMAARYVRRNAPDLRIAGSTSTPSVP